MWKPIISEPDPDARLGGSTDARIGDAHPVHGDQKQGADFDGSND
jgi:hypothetical protein